MNIPEKILFLFVVFIAQACGGKDCEDYLCTTPPGPFRFEIVDKATGENLFSNGTYQAGEIEIVNLSEEGAVEYRFIDENNLDLIQILSIGWETEKATYSVKIGDKSIFTLYVDAERLSEDCCSFTRFHEIRIENQEFEYDENTGIYKILID